MIKKEDLSKFSFEFIIEESNRLMNSSYYKDIYGPRMSPDAVSEAASVISEDLVNLLKSLYLISTGRCVKYDNLIDIYNHFEIIGLSKDINPNIWDEISLNITKWGKWNKVYNNECCEDIVSIRDVNNCELFCDQLKKYINALIKYAEEQ